MHFLPWLIACNLAVAGALIFGSIDSLKRSREADETAARQATVNIANSLSIEIEAELRLIDNALASIALTSAQEESPIHRSVVVARAIAEQKSLLPHVSALRFANTDGDVFLGLSPNELPINITHRPYFDEAKNSLGMVVSEPLISLVTNEWSLIFARALRTKSGVFQGVIYAVVKTDHYTKRFAELDMGSYGAIALRTKSLRLVARWAGTDASSMEGIGDAIVSPEMAQTLSEGSDKGSYSTHTAFDKIERIAAYSRLREYPLVVLTGLSADEILIPWRREVRRNIVLVGLIIIVIAGFSVHLHFQHRRDSHAHKQALKIAREQNLILENDLVGMVRVRGRKNIWANKALHRILGYEAGGLIGQSTRLFYLDEESYTKVGGGYSLLRDGGRFCEQVQMRRKDGRPIWIDLSGAMVTENESLWMMVDIDSLKQSETFAREMALKDPLTGLANRRLLEVQLENAIANAKRNKSLMALCYIDLDGFKQVNDHHGHNAGDILLTNTAQRLLDTVRGSDTVARLGGDEFAVILSPVTGAPEAAMVMERCLNCIAQEVGLDTGESVRVAASIGIAIGDGTSDPSDLITAADAAMYNAKREGRGKILISKAENNQRIESNLPS
jgi:diguanylate cyclase (GGDEF)-like protein/PAS domain S-box-containing protein